MKSTSYGYNVARVKRRAKHLKTELGIPHCRALDKAAQEHGYQNWSHFLHSRSKGLQVRRMSAAIPSGTLVRLKDTGELGIVFKDRSRSNLTSFYSEWGPGYAVRTEVSICRDQSRAADFIPKRLYLPYGMWTCENGAQVLFNRNYTPIWVKYPNGVVSSIGPATWILHSKDKEKWFFEGSPSEENIRTGHSMLRAWGVEDRKPLVVQLFPEAIRMGNFEMIAPKNFTNRFPT